MKGFFLKKYGVLSFSTGLSPKTLLFEKVRKLY